MNRAERDAAVENVAVVLRGLLTEHKATCTHYETCPTIARTEDALKALYQLRKGR